MENQTATQEVPGQEAVPASPQATETQAQPQPTSTVQVENGSQASTTETPRASEFETARQIKRLAKQMQSLQQIIENNSKSAPAPSASPQAAPQVTQQELLNDPLGSIKKLIAMDREQVLGMVTQTVTQRETEMQHKQAVGEGWRLIESSPAYKNDPEGRERINDILTEKNSYGNSLQEYSIHNPIHAAELAKIEYERRYGSKSPAPNAPTKAQMVSTATASYPTGAKLNINEEALKLQQEAYTNPDVMKDPGWKAKLAEITKQFNQQKIASAGIE